jgi:hypothetical protein
VDNLKNRTDEFVLTHRQQRFRLTENLELGATKGRLSESRNSF